MEIFCPVGASEVTCRPLGMPNRSSAIRCCQRTAEIGPGGRGTSALTPRVTRSLPLARPYGPLPPRQIPKTASQAVLVSPRRGGIFRRLTTNPWFQWPYGSRLIGRANSSQSHHHSYGPRWPTPGQGTRPTSRRFQVCWRKKPTLNWLVSAPETGPFRAQGEVLGSSSGA